MWRTVLFVFCLVPFSYGILPAQVPVKRLPGSVNMATASQIYPSLTGDGTYMVFYSNYTNAGDFQLMYSKKMRGGWDRGTSIDIYKSKLDHIGSHCLSYDGNFLFFSSMRSKGIGGFDIWYSERKGDGWSAPQNIGKPVNSTGHEGHPSLSPDGNTLYFIRCETMDRQNKGACTICTAERKSNGRWSEPAELPTPVNLRHETSPRILMDNETLIFASDRSGGQGQQDLYVSRREGSVWSRPVAMGFINNAANNEYVSVPAGGKVIYYTDVYKNRHHLYKAILPEELRPRKILMMTGRVISEGGDHVPGIRVQAYDAVEGTIHSSLEPEPSEGTFFMTLTEGRVYDFSVFPSGSGYTYYASLIDMTAPERSTWSKPEIKIERIRPGTKILEAFTFEKGTADPGHYSKTAYKRLAGFVKMNPGLEVDVVLVADTTAAIRVLLSPVEEMTEDEGEELSSGDDWIDDSAWFGADESSAGEPLADSTSIVQREDQQDYDPTLALDRAMTVVNELQSYGCDISRIVPKTDIALTSFDRPVADSLGYVVEIRLSR